MVFQVVCGVIKGHGQEVVPLRKNSNKNACRCEASSSSIANKTHIVVELPEKQCGAANHNGDTCDELKLLNLVTHWFS